MNVMSTTSAIDNSISTEYVSANGLRFEVDMCGDPSSKKLAICLHGFPEHSVSWRNQLPMLAALDYKVGRPICEVTATRLCRLIKKIMRLKICLLTWRH